MALIVQKFGGTSVGTVDRIRAVSGIIAKTQRAGHDVVVVVSAMAGETDRLINLAGALSVEPSARDYDALISTGETVSAALLSIALQEQKASAIALTGEQAGIFTTDNHRRASITHINAEIIRNYLSKKTIPVITGFQGVNSIGEVTTLERGGSDTSAVAIAAALKADECQIYTDVDGVYTADPRVVPDVKLLELLTYTEMLTLANLGAKVLHRQAMEFAERHHIQLRVLSSFHEGEGTMIVVGEKNPPPRVSGIAIDPHQLQFSFLGIPSDQSTLDQLMQALEGIAFAKDMTMQNHLPTEDCFDCVFTTREEDAQAAILFSRALANTLKARELKIDEGRAKVSLVGLNMAAHPEFSAKIFQTLGEQQIPIYLITSTEAKISVLTDVAHAAQATKLLHTAFALNCEGAQSLAGCS
ncbi:MAG: aspartate kinase [Gammaproteobacteria bacterium RIFCSPHIGHO2_12_FULL_42_13]|nr:MAG: aspartate kinase [Gammaproteobacteria bacterium RIFCSPHIGHO2_12_FULL_42_13]